MTELTPKILHEFILDIKPRGNKVFMLCDGQCYKIRKNGRLGLLIGLGGDDAKLVKVSRVKC